MSCLKVLAPETGGRFVHMFTHSEGDWECVLTHLLFFFVCIMEEGLLRNQTCCGPLGLPLILPITFRLREPEKRRGGGAVKMLAERKEIVGYCPRICFKIFMIDVNSMN